jgi:carboxypeptidase Taq
MSSDAGLKQLTERLREINDLDSAGALLSWDQSTYMPPGGAEARGRQLATLSRLMHEKLTHPDIGELLDALEPYARSLPYDSPDAALIRVTRRDYQKAIKVPPEFVAEMSRQTSASYMAWTRARPDNDFPSILPYLQRTLDLSREFAGFFPGYDHVADPLIDVADQGATARRLRKLFGELRSRLVPLVRSIAERPPIDTSCLRGTFPEAQQVEFGLDVVRRFGFDIERGRLDRSPHPFTTRFSIGDVRITTRVRESTISDALFSTLHEAGHAMYEQGVDPSFEGTPLARGVSSGVHESQSRLWENMVGKSRAFWSFFFPRLSSIFPAQLGSVTLADFYRAINKVEPSLIRTDADEVTYNLHVMIRFDLELDLLEGKLAASDLPDAWRERCRRDLGLVPPDDRDGVLQDVHWYGGLIGGAFQGYTMGNVLSAQLFEAAVAACPEIPSRIENGRFEELFGWLGENLYHHGAAFTPAELIERAAGGPLDIEPYMRYLTSKYSEIYSL